MDGIPKMNRWLRRGGSRATASDRMKMLICRQATRASIVLAFASLVVLCTQSTAKPIDRPNILWITSEDNGPHLGAYGDTFADTPNLDRLAARGTRYRVCWSNAPVCAPARTTIISGIYPTSTGAQHMRSLTRLPDAIRMFPCYLRDAGYYCTNNSKEDYNLVKTGKVWDESSRDAHWKNRPDGTPFFAVFNSTISHESKIRTRPHKAVHDPALVRVPAYHPDRSEVRQDWAQYYDRLTEMDQELGDRLAELEEAGLSDQTIVVYWGDHGSGMPRNKRWLYDSGLHVPCIVYLPPQWRNVAPSDYGDGGESQRLVGFIDLAPTMLSLVGIEPKDHMQGHAFLGPYATEPPPYLFGFRDRMDEAYDISRSVRDDRYVYIRNYYPHQPCGQFLEYMFQTPTTRVWKGAFDAGELNQGQARFWRPKVAEELYDLQADRDEVRNLIEEGTHDQVADRLRAALQTWITDVKDLGCLPEEMIHHGSGSRAPFDAARDGEWDLPAIWHAANVATQTDGSTTIPDLVRLVHNANAVIRYWGVVGMRGQAEAACREAGDVLRAALDDPSGSVQAMAAETMLVGGDRSLHAAAIKQLIDLADIDDHNPFVAIRALGALRQVPHLLRPYRGQIALLPERSPGSAPRVAKYVGRLQARTLALIDSQ